MKIQSAGRLGNILFIWAYALSLAHKSRNQKVEIFADKYHSPIDEDLKENFFKLSSKEVNFLIDNKSGLVLRILDRAALSMPKLSSALQRKLRIQTEFRDVLSQKAWIQRGYFQDPKYFENIKEEIHSRLKKIINDVGSSSQLKSKFPYLEEEYQAIHVRLSDFVGSAAGVIQLQSQLNCLDNCLKTIICTDGTREDVLSRTDRHDYEIITTSESTAWETLAILSGAKFLVTSNSTLSWWSGFVAAGNGKSVWIPKIWNKKMKTTIPLPFENVQTYLQKFE
jgi:hypothetical protein